MFEIYREDVHQGAYRVVYFTELEEHNRESEISRAMAGEHFYDGFIAFDHRESAKQEIAETLDLLNGGESLTRADVGRRLSSFEPPRAL
ncbi:MAG TPA: hypothetical protein VE398_08255 [Acidobacteriota bacterium]|nr:hypothetical protein [Acidobacteriota bacterium]